MPEYVEKALHRFQHTHGKIQHAPHPAPKPHYGQRCQYIIEDTSKPAKIETKKEIQKIVGTSLYYTLTIDLTMLVALRSIASQQNAPTEKTMTEVTWFLDHSATHPDAKIRYHASDMILWSHSDASYLSEQNSKSRAGDLFFLSEKVENPGKPPTKAPKLNGIVACLAKIIRQIMSSAMEAEVCTAYENARKECPIRKTLKELCHQQPPTPMQVNNAAAVGYVNKTIKHKRSKAPDMRFHWIADKVQKRQFVVYWSPGADNWADYITKHHPAAHHKLMRAKFFES